MNPYNFCVLNSHRRLEVVSNTIKIHSFFTFAGSNLLEVTKKSKRFGDYHLIYASKLLVQAYRYMNHQQLTLDSEDIEGVQSTTAFELKN